MYSGDTDFLTSTSTSLTQTVNKASTTTTVVSSANPSVTGQSVTYTATVAAVSPGAGTPTGLVTFKDGASTITCTSGTQTLNGSGIATCTLAYPGIGTHSITGVYSGDANFLTSTSSIISQDVVSASVVGLAFANVTVAGSPVTPTCTGLVGTTYTCTVTAGNNGIVVTNFTFASSSQMATVYSAQDQSLPWTATGKASPNSGTLTVLANQSTTSATATMQKNGVNSAAITVTFNTGSTIWTAVLKTT